jgi:Domain of unknown function (DUF4191)
MAKKTPEESMNRRGQLRAAWKMAYKVDRTLPLIVAAVFLVVFGIFLALGFIIGNLPTFVIVGVTSGVIAALVVFGRRAERAALKTVEGQTGAAASILTTLRKGWTLTPAVAVTRNQDLVHRLTGRAGVVLVAEGRPAGATALLTSERKRVQRVAPDAPVHEILIGDGEGQVPLRKLTRRIMKLPRALRPADVTQLNHRLKALDNQRGQLPIPKGPLPKNARMPKVPRS